MKRERLRAIPAPRHLRRSAAALALLAATAGTAAWGAGLVDPTLAPPGWDASAEPSAHAADPAASPESNRLQMILLQGPHRTAILGNRSLKVGDAFEFNGSPARVLSIGDNGLVLQQGSEHVTLNLVDDVAAVRRVDQCPAPVAGAARCRKP